MLKKLTNRRASPKEAMGEALAGRELPSFPTVALEAARLLRDPDVPLMQVASVLRNDPSISTGLLRMTNSPAFGLRSEVRNVEHAVSLLGRAQTESAVVAAAARAALPMPKCDGFDPRRFWALNCARALAAKALGKLLDCAGTSELFTATLLQDMAVPLLLTAKGEDYAAVLEAWRAGEAELHALETERFGWHHAEVAAGMCEAWRFPEALTQAIEHHHDQPADGVAQLASLVAGQRAADDEGERAHLAASLAARLNLHEETLLATLAQACEAGHILAAQLS